MAKISVHTHILFTMLLAALLLTACDLIPGNDESQDIALDEYGMEIKNIDFSDDYNTITLTTEIYSDPGFSDATDTSEVKVKVQDLNRLMIPATWNKQPKIKSIRYINDIEFDRNGVMVSMLVDLTQPAAVINKQRDMVKRIAHDILQKDLFITFMLPDGKMSPCVQATPYIINNYITPQSRLLTGYGKDEAETSDSLNHAYLYRSVATSLEHMQSRTGTALDSARYKTLVVFSDGVVYNNDNNTPLDPEHFQMQEKLIDQCRTLPENLVVYYVELGNTIEAEEAADPADAAEPDATAATVQAEQNDIMSLLCQKSRGKVMHTGDCDRLLHNVQSRFGLEINDLQIVLQNADKRIYIGRKNNFKLDFYSLDDSLLISCTKDYRLGSIYNPIIIGDYPSEYFIYIRGIFFLVLLSIVAYLLLQIVYPYANNIMFRRKFVVKYSGANMSINGHVVPDTCYYCKAPFKVGEMIVGKCEHIMHESCWDENGGHCPEFGSHCNDGSHMYDKHNILNKANAPFILRWVMLALMAAAAAWTMIGIFEGHFVYNIIDDIAEYFLSLDGNNTVLRNNICGEILSPRLYDLAVFLCACSMTLTFAMAYITRVPGHQSTYSVLSELVMRATTAYIITLALFILEIAIVVFSGIYDGLLFLDIFPLTGMTVAICYCSTYHTRVRPDKKRIMIGSGIIGLLTAILWTVFGESDSDNFVTTIWILMTNLAVVATIAKPMPKSKHVMLYVYGASKDMQIALYKWLNQSPNAIVTIGRSVDASIQISWDKDSRISPVHASIRMYHGRPQLTTVDGDVVVNEKNLPQGKSFVMYHGDEFIIGTTRFRLVE